MHVTVAASTTAIRLRAGGKVTSFRSDGNLMRLIVLQACIAVAVVLFMVTLSATVVHRARRGPGDARRNTLLSEYIWALIPWAIMVTAAFPAVKMMVTEH